MKSPTHLRCGALAIALFAVGCETPPAADSRAAAQPQAPPAPTADAPQPQQLLAVEDDEPSIDGAYLYRAHCSGCHNDNGDGQGATMVAMNLTARSFAQGGFAFGNTREAIFKTITAGMPGSDVMPSFQSTLSEEERWLIADHVLTLMPAAEEPARNSALRAIDGAVIARGLLQPIVEGKPHRERGLLIGYPEGLTFEYRIDDVRLLGVRQGEFADRPDWNDRGGAPLVALGSPSYLFAGGDPGPTFALLRGNERRPVTARLRKTWARGDDAGLAYDIVDETGKVRATFEESHQVEPLSIGGAFTRIWRGQATDGGATLVVTVAGSTEIAEWVRGTPRQWKVDMALETGPMPKDGWIVAKRGESFELVRVVAPPSAKVVRHPGSVHVMVPLFVTQASGTSERPVAELRATIVKADHWSDELLAKLAKEIKP